MVSSIKQSSSCNDSEALLDFLIELQHLHVHSEHPTSSTQTIHRHDLISNWLEEDFYFLKKFLTLCSETWDVTSIFAIQRAVSDNIQVVLLTNANKLEAVSPRILQDIENVLGHYGFGTLNNVSIRLIEKPSSRSLNSETAYSFTYPCIADDTTFGLIGFITNQDLLSSSTNKVMTILANYLGFRFSHLYKLRNEEINRRTLQHINLTCNLITASVSINDIIELLVSTLELLFQQSCGAIFLTKGVKKQIECVRKFGRAPENFDVEKAVNDEPLKKIVFEGGACQFPPDHPIRYLVPLVPGREKAVLPTSEDISGETLGILVLYNLPENKVLSDDERVFMGILLNGVGASLYGAFNYQEKIDTIRALENMINKLSSKDELLDEMISLIRKLLHVDRCSFLVVDPEKQFLTIEKQHGLPPEVVEKTRIPIGQEISGYVAKTGKSVRVADIEKDERFRKRSLEYYFNKSLLSVPLVLMSEDGEKQVMGVINVNNKITGLPFTDQDQTLLEVVAELVAVALKNNQLRRIESLLEAARHVQTSLLPKRFKGLPPNLDVFGISIPALQVGGDFFDALKLKDNRWLFAIGDVSGKGMPAAILMATTRIILRTVSRHKQNPCEILCDVNAILSDDLETINLERGDFHFVTMTILVLDPKTGQIEFASAGQGPFLVNSKSGILQVNALAGRPLGFPIDEVGYKKSDLHLQPGDCILLFTDGLYEEGSPSKEMLGIDRVESLFNECLNLSAQETVERMVAEAVSWRGNKEAHDDLTIMAIKFKDTLST